MIHLATVLGFDGFAENIAMHLNAGFARIERRIFPDTEVCPRIPDVPEAGHVVFVNRMSLPLNPNSHLVETLIVLKNLSSSGIEDIDVVMPYFVYGRQDKIFREGEPFSARYVLELLRDAGASRFFTVSSHAERDKAVLGVADIPAFNINGFVAIGQYLKGLALDNPMIVGPDKGAEGFVETVASALGCDSALFEKHRDLVTGDVIMRAGVNVKGRDVILVDDIIGSGGTMLKAIDLCKEARRIYCAVVHMVSDRRVREMQEKTKQFIICNTIDSPKYHALQKVSVEELIAGKIKEA